MTCLGEALIDFVAADSLPLQDTITFLRAAGGAPANVAVALARLGIHAAFVGKISADVFGRSLRQTFTAEHVDLRGVVEDASARTPLVFVGSKGDGGRSFVFYHDGMADTLLRPEEVLRSRDMIAHSAVFHFGSVTLAAEPGASATLEAVRWARQSGCLVSFDPNVRLEVWSSSSRARDCTLDALRMADVVKVSSDEVEFLTGTCDLAEACRRLREYGPRLAAVTLGPAGCFYSTPSSSGYVPGVAVEVVDTLGAGDAFLAGLLAGLLDAADGRHLLDDDAPPLDALRFANAVGAITTTRYGAIPALPSRNEVEVLLRA